MSNINRLQDARARNMTRAKLLSHTNSEAIEIPKTWLPSGRGDYFALTVKGDDMIDDCLLDGDVLIVKRQNRAANGQTVMAIVKDEATVKKYFQRESHVELSSRREVITVPAPSDIKILGVIERVIRRVE